MENKNLIHFILTQRNVEERQKSLGTSRHIGNSPLALTEVERIVSLIRQDLKAQGFAKSERANAYASALKNASHLKHAGQHQLTTYFRNLHNPVSDLVRVVSAYGWEQEDFSAERKGFGNALFIALGLLTFRDWERYHGHSCDFEIQYVTWFARFSPDEFNAGASIALQAHHALGFSLLAEMKGRDPLPWFPENMGGAL